MRSSCICLGVFLFYKKPSSTRHWFCRYHLSVVGTHPYIYIYILAVCNKYIHTKYLSRYLLKYLIIKYQCKLMIPVNFFFIRYLLHFVFKYKYLYYLSTTLYQSSIIFSCYINSLCNYLHVWIIITSTLYCTWNLSNILFNYNRISIFKLIV